MNEVLQLESYIQSVRTLLDSGLKLTIITPELSAEDATKLFALKGKQGWMLFKETAFSESDIINLPTEIKEFKGDKTPAQKMRAIIYKIWETNTDRKKPFPDYYNSYMFKLNEALKEKIND